MEWKERRWDSPSSSQPTHNRRVVVAIRSQFYFCAIPYPTPHPVRIDLNQKLDPKQKTIQIFNIYAQGFRKSKNENPPLQEIVAGGEGSLTP